VLTWILKVNISETVRKITPCTQSCWRTLYRRQWPDVIIRGISGHESTRIFVMPPLDKHFNS